MSFSSQWLALREPADHASRDAGLLARATAVVGRHGVVADLGSGTGSTARAFADPHCAGWTWRFMDGDSALLRLAKAQHPASQTQVLDLDKLTASDIAAADLVTASALLDLMPRDWVVRLAELLQQAAVPFYAALNYNGIMHWSPAGDSDAVVVAAFNSHQGTDKGLGPALGPNAASETAAIFADHGFEVFQADSPWHLGPEQAALHRATLQGIAEAAAETGTSAAADWYAQHERQLDTTTGYIGHTDVLALPRRTGE